MALNRHKQFRLDFPEKKWSEKWFKFIISREKFRLEVYS